MQLLKESLLAAAIPFDENQLFAFQKYHQLLLEWNRRTNLISKADRCKIVESHFLESVAVLASIEIKRNANILDVGSGAGFPALPISLLRPDLCFFLVESKRKKALFLRHVVAQLKLKNVFVLDERCEALVEKEQFLNFFDFVFSRAVGRLELVYGWVQKMMKPHCSFVAWKGGDVASEINSFVLKYKNKTVELLKMDERLVKKEKKRSLIVIQ